jgi:hypothetical protein
VIVIQQTELVLVVVAVLSMLFAAVLWAADRVSRP